MRRGGHGAADAGAGPVQAVSSEELLPARHRRLLCRHLRDQLRVPGCGRAVQVTYEVLKTNIANSFQGLWSN